MAQDLKAMELKGWGAQVLIHLKTARPKMYRQLMEANKLQEYADQMDRTASDLQQQLIAQGANPMQIQEAIREEIFPLTEAEQPILGGEVFPTRA